MIAVGVLVSYAADLAELDMGVGILVGILTLQGWWHIGVVAWLARTRLLSKVLTRQQEHLLVEATDDRDFRLLLLLLLTLILLLL